MLHVSYVREQFYSRIFTQVRTWIKAVCYLRSMPQINPNIQHVFSFFCIWPHTLFSEPVCLLQRERERERERAIDGLQTSGLCVTCDKIICCSLIGHLSRHKSRNLRLFLSSCPDLSSLNFLSFSSSVVLEIVTVKRAFPVQYQLGRIDGVRGIMSITSGINFDLKVEVLGRCYRAIFELKYTKPTKTIRRCKWM